MRTSFDSETCQWPELGQAAYRILENQIAPNLLRIWIQPLEWLSVKETDQGKIIQLRAANEFSAEWIRDHHQKLLEEAFTQVSGSHCKIEIDVEKRADNPLIQRQDLNTSLEPTFPQEDLLTVEDPHKRVSSKRIVDNSSNPIRYERRNFSKSIGSTISIDPRYTFDTFVVGASNQFAHASAVAVAERPGQQYNPLFIYSSPGLGKTHLLHAIANHIMAKNPSTRVVYVSAEQFVNELIESIQHNKMTDFRTKFRNSYDILLIDDIQFIAGKEKTEEEFFHTFNALYSSKRQIILTCDRPPKDIEGLEERVRTRFEWGLIADIQPPEIETRIAILKTKAETDDIYLPDDVATFLASHIKKNVRELEGILIRLQAQASLTGAEISLEMAKNELKLSVPEEGSLLTVETIQTTVAKHFGIKVHELKSNTRAKLVSLPRQIAIFLIRKYTGIGYKEIGQWFGGKDHSTIMHACKKIEDAMEKDDEIRDAVEGIQNQL